MRYIIGTDGIPYGPFLGTSTVIGDMRACPDCGRPQHYTGTEHGWAHDALIDMWHCADPREIEHRLSNRKAGA